MSPDRILHGAHFQGKVQSKEDDSAVETEKETEDNDMAEEQDNQDFTVDIPDIPMPEAPEEDPDVVKDEVEGAFKFAFIGVGQGGSRIAESFYKLGYRRVCCVNTNQQDLAGIDIPEGNKFVMTVDEGGAGKDMTKGASAAEEHREDIYDLMRRNFGKDVDRILVCVGSGGGTGGGGVGKVIDVAHEVAKSLKIEEENGLPAVGAVTSMPKLSEGTKVNANAYTVLNELFDRVGKGTGKLGGRTVSPLLIIDNEKVDKIYPNLPVAKFWDVANSNISGLLHLFNNIACRDSEYTTFDKADFESVLNSGIMTLGACPVKSWKSETDISRAIRDNLKRNVLVEGFDLNQASVAACVFIGSSDVFEEIPQGHLEHGFEMLGRIMSSDNVIHRGIYQGSKSGLVIYTVMAELGKPEERLEEIAHQGGVS